MATQIEGEARMEAWVERFRFYRDPPTATAISAWIDLFDEHHRDLAQRVLDEVIVVSEREIQRGYKAALDALPDWSPDHDPQAGRWFFVGFGRAGESGPAMVRPFREANNLALGRYDRLFCALSDLPALMLTARDNVVFIDDFSGTGRQVCKLWPTVAELIASEATCYLILTAITEVAARAIEDRTDLNLYASKVLTEEDNVVSQGCSKFSAEEKEVILQYGVKADPRWPAGYGKSGLLLVLSHKTPNNSLPIIHVNEEHWRGLFPRYLRAA
jgi:hypothetical protein